MITLDEAIEHAEDVADEYSTMEEESCRQCGSDHAQLAAWLRELKYLRSQVRMEDVFVGDSFNLRQSNDGERLEVNFFDNNHWVGALGITLDRPVLIKNVEEA